LITNDRAISAIRFDRSEIAMPRQPTASNYTSESAFDAHDRRDR